MNRSRMLQSLISANAKAIPSLDLQSTQSLESYSLVNFTRSTPKWFFNESGLLEEAPANTLPASYDPVTLERKGWLIEESRTRLNTIAEAPTANEDISVSATSYTISFFGTGTITLSGAHSATINGEGAFPTRTILTFTPTSGTLTISYSGSCEHVQLEAGSFASSVIKGEGSQVTRSADVPTITDMNWFNDSEGTFLVEFWKGINSGRFTVLLSANSGSTPDGHSIYSSYFDTQITYQVPYGGDYSGYSFNVDATFDQFNTLGCSYSDTKASFVLNGALSVQTVGELPINPATRLNIGRNRNNEEYTNSFVKYIAYYPRQLSDNELQTIAS